MPRRKRTSWPNPYHQVLRELNRAGVEYVVIGVSGINYFAKDARQILSTADYDVFLEPTSQNIARAWKALHKSGFAVAVRKGDRLRALHRLSTRVRDELARKRQTLVGLGPYQLIVEALLSVSGFT